MQPPSRRLVESASRGDAVALEELLERHLPDLERFVRLRTGQQLRDKESCSDLVQSVCREILQDLRDFTFDSEGLFRLWLFQQAERKLKDKARHWSRQKRDPRREVAWPDGPSSQDPLGAAARAPGPSPSRLAALREEVERLHGLFDRLPETWREVIVLSRVVGLSHDEIAAQTGRTTGAVRVLLCRALARLGTLLPPSGESGNP